MSYDLVIPIDPQGSATLPPSRHFREVLARPAEIRAIRRGRAEIKQDKYVTLNQLLDELERPRRRKSRKALLP